MTWSEFFTGVGATAAPVAAGAAVFAAIYTRRIMQAGQKQVKVSQEQFRQSVEAERDAQLPVLVPIEPLLCAEYGQHTETGLYAQPTKSGYDRTLPFARIAIKNAGPGIALNIWGVVFESEPEWDSLRETGQHHSHRYDIPLGPGQDIKKDWTAGSVPVRGDKEMVDITAAKRYRFYAPRQPTLAESQRGETEKVARLTLTYSDIFGRKHAAIYDFTMQHQWENVAYLRNIEQDLSDMEREALQDAPVYRAPKPTVSSPE